MRVKTKFKTAERFKRRSKVLVGLLLLFTGCGQKQTFNNQFEVGQPVKIVVDGSRGQVVRLRGGEVFVRTQNYDIKLFNQFELNQWD